MKLGFLLGAGVSLSCGAPGTDVLTDVVLRGDDVHRCSDGTYFLSAQNHPGLGDQDAIGRIRCFLAFLKSHANNFFSERKERDRVANYEDLYYLVTQLADAVDEYENPAVSDFLETTQKAFVMPELPRQSAFPSSDLFDETRQYIRGVVSRSLSVPRPTDAHLGQIVQAATDRSVANIEIFTLNHDCLIESALRRADVPFSDGFAPFSKDLRCWDRREFQGGRTKVRLGKLHGSVDWYPMRFLRNGPSRVCIATNGDVQHARGPEGGAPTLLRDRPEMLLGTFNKMLEYTMGIYADLSCAFRAALTDLDRLVISGYSFGDKGVNACITEWMREGAWRRVLIIAPQASGYRITARGAIRRLFAECDAQITSEDTTFDAVTWPMIREWSGTSGCVIG